MEQRQRNKDTLGIQKKPSISGKQAENVTENKQVEGKIKHTENFLKKNRSKFRKNSRYTRKPALTTNFLFLMISQQANKARIEIH